MAIRAVILDVGGVLERTPPTGWQDRWCQRLGIDSGDLDARMGEMWQRGAVGAASLKAIERHTAGALGLDPAGLRAFMDDVWAEYLGTLNAELAGWFESLRPRYRTAILSNSFVGAREREQARYGFQDMCDAVVYSHEIGVRKPDAAAYEIVCDRLRVRADEAVFVDDTVACVEGARRVGMTAVRFIDTTQALGEVRRCLAGGAPLPVGGASAAFDPAPLEEFASRGEVAEILVAFLDHCDRALPDLAGAVRDRRADAVDRVAHGLAGSAGTIGAPGVAAAARTLCDLARGDPGDYDQAFSALAAAAAEAQTAIRGYLGGDVA